MNNAPLRHKYEPTPQAADQKSEQSIVSVDMSNVMNWSGEVFQQEPDGTVKKEIYRVNVPKLVRHLRASDAYVRVYSPHVNVPHNFITEVMEWAKVHCPEIIVGMDHYLGEPVPAKLARAIGDYMKNSREKLEIPLEIRMKMSVLTRANTWAHNSKLCANNGFEVHNQPVNINNKSLHEDHAHKSAVSRIMQVGQEIRDSFETIPELSPETLSHARKTVLKLYNDVEATARGLEEATDKDHVLALLDQLAEYKARVTNVLKATNQIVDILDMPSAKCDMDAKIVARSMDPEIIANFNNFSFWSGDRDFDSMYEVLSHHGKNVTVVSPRPNLSKVIEKMATRGQLEIHRPDFADPIWHNKSQK